MGTPLWLWLWSLAPEGVGSTFAQSCSLTLSLRFRAALAQPEQVAQSAGWGAPVAFLCALDSCLPYAPHPSGPS